MESSSYAIQTNDGQSTRGTTRASNINANTYTASHGDSDGFLSRLLFSFADHTFFEVRNAWTFIGEKVCVWGGGLKKIQKCEVVADDFVNIQ